MTAEPTARPEPPHGEAAGPRQGGLPATAALGATLVLTVAAGWLDLHLYGTIGRLVSTVFVLGCVATVLAVRRRGLLLVMLSTPLVPILAILIVVLAFTRHNPDTTVLLLSAAQPVVAHFPAIAGTTALVAALGTLRIVRPRKSIKDTAGRESRPTTMD